MLGPEQFSVGSTAVFALARQRPAKAFFAPQMPRLLAVDHFAFSAQDLMRRLPPPTGMRPRDLTQPRADRLLSGDTEHPRPALRRSMLTGEATGSALGHPETFLQG